MRTIRLLVAAALLSPAPLAAQTLQGRISDGRAAVADAEVTLEDEAGGIRGRTASDPNGFFSVSVERPGSYRIRVRHLAYLDLESELISVGAAETVTLEIRLSEEPLRMAPITVSARSGDPRHAAFYERRLSRRQGTFITRADIDRTPQARTTDLLRGVSGITIRLTHERGRSAHRANLITLRNGMCEPALFIDGVRVSQQVQSGMDDVLQPGMLEGIEIYTNVAAAPAGFSGRGTDCGVVMFWTRNAPDPGRTGLPWSQAIVGIGLLGALFLLSR